MRRDDICLYLGPADRAQLEALRADRNTPRKVVVGVKNGEIWVVQCKHTTTAPPTKQAVQEVVDAGTYYGANRMKDQADLILREGDAQLEIPKFEFPVTPQPGGVQ